MKKFITALLVIAAILTISAAAFAEGYAVSNWSAGANAMAQNYMFAEDDAAIISFNPAGITKLKGRHISKSLSLLKPTVDVDIEDIYGIRHNLSNDAKFAFVPSTFYTCQTSNKTWWGIGLFSRFGRNSEFNIDNPQLIEAVNASKLSMKTITVQPVFAYKPAKKWSLAAGLDLNYLIAEIKSKTHAGGFTYKEDLSGKSFNVGWLLSAMYDFNDRTSAAITYRSRINHSGDLDAEMKTNTDMEINTKAHSELPLPDTLTIGIGHKFSPKTRIEASATWTNWQLYDVLKFTYKEPYIEDDVTEKDWHNTWSYGIGIEHRLNEKWTLMGGYKFDQRPGQANDDDLLLPQGSRHIGSLGFKCKIKPNMDLVFAYTGIWVAGRDWNKATTAARVDSSYISQFSIGLNMKLK